MEMRFIRRSRMDDHEGASRGSAFKWFLLLLLLLIAIAAAILFVRFPEGEKDLLASLPPPAADAPSILMSTHSGEFPLHIVRLFLDSSTVSPAGSSPLTALLPALDEADRAALVITERANGLAMYAAFSLDETETGALVSGNLPESWASLFLQPEVYETDQEGLLQIRALNLTSPLYVEARGETAYAADDREDILRVHEILSRKAAGVEHSWKLDEDWPGRLHISDGGVIGTIVAGTEPTDRLSPVMLEVGWRNGKKKGAESGEAAWQISGVESLFDAAFLKALQTHDWTADDPFVPDPSILSFGFNLPTPAKNLNRLPSLLHVCAEHLERLGLKNADIRTILSGPTTVSLGGRTQLLWFEFPGATIDLPGRGKAGEKLIEKFWGELFMGAKPKPLPDFSFGGTTDLPFTILAAGNEERVVLGLTGSALEQSGEAQTLLRTEPPLIGWLYIDLPSLGTALAEMPTMNAMLFADGDSESTTSEGPGAGMDLLRQNLEALGRAFITLDSPANGRAKWYN